MHISSHTDTVHTNPTTTNNLPQPPANLPSPPAPTTKTSNLFISTSHHSFRKPKATIGNKTEEKRKESRRRRSRGPRYHKTYRTVTPPPRSSSRANDFTPQPHPTFAIDLLFALHLTRQPICKKPNKMQKSKKFKLLRESDLKAKS